MNVSLDTPGRSLKRLTEITGDIARDAVEQAIRANGLVSAERSTLEHRVDEHRVRGRYHWWIKDLAPNPHRVVASGAAFRWKRAAAQLERAYKKALAEVAFRRAVAHRERQQAADADQLDAEAQALVEGGCE